MKKLTIAVVLSLVLITVGSGVALAKAQKVSLTPIGSDSGSGFVVFNDTSGPDNVQLEMSLKGALANTTYDVIVHMNGADAPVGTVTTNTKGNANFHWSWSEAGSGNRRLGLGLKREGVWQFGTGAVYHYFK